MNEMHWEHIVPGDDFTHAGNASGEIKAKLKDLGFAPDAIRRVAIVTYEAEMNMVLHAGGGVVHCDLTPECFSAVFEDQGPGIPNVNLAMQAGWSTASPQIREMGFGAGMGLPNIQRYSDSFDLQTKVGEGTRLSLSVNLDEKRPPMVSIPREPIYLDTAKCNGCTTCTRRCPTEAIRVHNGKATIISERCVACGECIRVCPQHAMKGRSDSLDDVFGQYKYTVALPAPALYGQFPNIQTRTPILEGLKRIGFDDVFEVATAAEVVSASTHYELQYGSIPHPIITTACPVILRLVRIRFPSLLPHLLNYRSPTELAGRWGRALAVKKTGLKPEEIGCVFISPCSAKYASNKAPLFIPDSALSAVVSIEEVVPRLMPIIEQIDDKEKYAQASAIGVKWAISGGQAEASKEPNHLAASGMENIIKILEALEDGKLANTDMIELNACYPGCVGGALCVENPFIAKSRINNILRHIGPVLPTGECPTEEMRWEHTPTPNPVLQLDADVNVAMEKMNQIQNICKDLPGIDCGACGSPSCKAFAEDVIAGRTTLEQCLVKKGG